MSKLKPLTEKGSLFNQHGNKYRPSVVEYRNKLHSFFLNKELGEYVGRFVWNGLPKGLDSNIIETMLYYKGQLMLFKIAEKFYILPFVYTNKINHYGIQTNAIPIPYSGVITNNEDKVEPFTHERTVTFWDDSLEDSSEEIGIILRSHSSLHFGATVPMIALTDALRDKLSENMSLIRNNLILAQAMKYVRVESEAKAKSVQSQMDNLLTDILNGNIIQTIVGTLTLQDVNTEVPKIQQQEMWQSFASLDNLRMEMLGILNNGVFEKRERNLSDEVAGKQTVSKLLLQDAWNMRKKFCELCKHYFGLNISVELSDMNDPNESEKANSNLENDRRMGEFENHTGVND